MEFYTNVESWGDFIFVKGYDKNGNHFFRKEKYDPVLYLHSKKTTQYKSLKDEYLEPFYAGSIKESRNFIKRYEDVSNFEFFGQTNYPYNYIAEKYKKDITYDFEKIRVGFFDIETECENGFPKPDEAKEEITIINILFRGKYYFFNTQKWGHYKPDRKDVVNMSYPTEKEMLLAFLDFWGKVNFDIISGWYSEGFDIPYIINRLVNLFGMATAKKLSPWGVLKEKELKYKGKPFMTYEVMGVTHLDYMQLDKKFTLKPRENAKLDTIANEELNIKKLDYSVYGSLHELYRSDWQHFCNYSIRDVELLFLLNEKMRLIELVCEIAYYSKVNFQDTLFNTRVWDQIIYTYLLERGIVVPQRDKDRDTRPFDGGYVKHPQIGIHDYPVSFDLNSLYPNLIVQYNISPETFVGQEIISFDKLVAGDDTEIRHLKEMGYSVAANGTYYKKEKVGFLAELSKMVLDKRNENKALKLDFEKKAEKETEKDKKDELKKQASMFNIKQSVFKVLGNSLYGAVGNEGFRFFMRLMAEAITKSGQLSVLWTMRNSNEYFNKKFETDKDYVLYADTDSCYLDFSMVASKAPEGKEIDLLDAFSDKVFQPKLNEFFKNLYEFMNANEPRMKMKREAIAYSSLFVTKKKYLMLLADNEGVRFKEPKLKVTGIEMVRSSTPKFCKDKLNEAAKLILKKDLDVLRKYVSEVKDEFLKLDPEEIGKPTGVNGIEKYRASDNGYASKTPFHVRGSLIFNKKIIDLGLERKYSLISDNDKIKVIYLKLPNPFFENVISIPDIIPPEFDLIQYVDHETQFEKVFLSPLKLMTVAAGWDLDKKSSLKDFI